MNNDKYNIDTAILYRKKGTHYADSNIEPGLQSANLVSDDTNQVRGTPMVEIFDLDEIRRQERQLQKQEDSKYTFIASLITAGIVISSTYIWNHGGKKAAASALEWGKNRLEIFGKKSGDHTKDQHLADSNSVSDKLSHVAGNENIGTEIIDSSPENSVSAFAQTDDSTQMDIRFLISPAQYYALLRLRQNAEQIVRLTSFILYNSTLDSTIEYLQRTGQPYVCYSPGCLENLKNKTVIQGLQPLSSSLIRTYEQPVLSESQTDPEADL